MGHGAYMEVYFAIPTRRRHKQPIEVGRRLPELLPLRPHITVYLVNRNRIQFHHANRAVVLVSSVIDLSLHDDKDLRPAGTAWRCDCNGVTRRRDL